MKELDYINIIKLLTKNDYIGDDCAYLKDLELVITQDNFVENIHFRTDWATPFQIGYKAAIVNISDILAVGAIPKYLTVGLSLPNKDDNFIKELYNGIIAGASGAEIIGGDITGGENLFISITAIGSTIGRKVSSRRNAKPGYVVVASGEHGLSSLGLKELQQGGNNQKYIKAHLEPILDKNFSEIISTQIETDYAMMDSSDGLADALFKIAKASSCTIKTPKVKGIFGAEDYKLVAAIPKEFLNKLDNYVYIGEVFDFEGYYLQIDNKNYKNYDELDLYNHFK